MPGRSLGKSFDRTQRRHLLDDGIWIAPTAGRATGSLPAKRNLPAAPPCATICQSPGISRLTALMRTVSAAMQDSGRRRERMIGFTLKDRPLDRPWIGYDRCP